MIKYRVREVAKDFDVTSKVITEILAKYGTAPKSTMQVLTDGELPEIRQLRYSLTNYMLTKDFQQTVTLSEADLRSLLLEKAVEQKTGAISIYD